MSKTDEVVVDDDDMRAEYDFSRAKMMPDRFASRFSRDVRSVVLDPDVAEFYPSAVAINALLRALIPVIEKQKAVADQVPMEIVATANTPPTPIEA